MICLAVNTANSVLSIALVDGDKTLSYFSTVETRDQGNVLIMNIKEALLEHNIAFKDIGLLGVVTGPGSFTGIRIGIAAVRGIAMAAKVPIVGMTSFDLYAEPKADFTNIVAIESWREELYFRVEGQEPVNLTPEDFVKKLKDGNYYVSGDAREKLRDHLPKAEFSVNDPNAEHLAKLALAKGPDAVRPVPYYLREPDVTIKKT